MSASSLAAPAPTDRRDSLIDFPSLFPIKVMGLHCAALEPAIIEIAQRWDPLFDTARIERRPSSGGKYLGLTITITATSRAQLDDLYRAFTTHPLVKVVL